MGRTAGLAVLLAAGLSIPTGWTAEAGAEAGDGTVFETMVRKPEVFRRRLEESFAKLLGSPRTLTLEYDAPRLSERLGGRFRRIAVAFEGGAIDLLRIKSARLEALDVGYDLEGLLAGRTFLPRSVGSTRIDLTVEEDALNAAAQTSKGRLGVEGPRFDLRQGEIVFSGRIKLLFMKNQLRLVGRLETAGGSQIHFRPSDVEVSRLSLPGFLVSALARRFNPVLDLSRAAFWKTFRAKLGALELTPGLLRLRTDPAPGEDLPGPATPPGFAAGEPADGALTGPTDAVAADPVLHSGPGPETL